MQMLHCTKTWYAKFPFTTPISILFVSAMMLTAVNWVLCYIWWFTLQVVGARVIGTPCHCPLKCWERMGSKILEIFNNFWDLSDFNLQNSYLFTCLKLCDVKRRYTKKVIVRHYCFQVCTVVPEYVAFQKFEKNKKNKMEMNLKTAKLCGENSKWDGLCTFCMKWKGQVASLEVDRKSVPVLWYDSMEHVLAWVWQDAS